MNNLPIFPRIATMSAAELATVIEDLQIAVAKNQHNIEETESLLRTFRHWQQSYLSTIDAAIARLARLSKES